ncbi:helix-turn-helix domain-containing protein [Flavicella sediminum]|uniref:helix-turn-helix domain-containing protein n=1 Tax=Flavicella sediminum TaxID=2585141 RepID=UPI00112485D3|nr:helix-turn-helix domain-containing protein [Flavicella sediminum]
MLSNEKKTELTEEILKSSLFIKSPKSSALLRYLVKATLEDIYLKEDIIDLEFFGEKSDFDRNNPRVRVNMYNLRKKIEKYYEQEGKESVWRLILEKGQYKVHFEKQIKPKSFFRKVKPKYLIPYILLLIVTSTYVYQNYSTHYPKIWKVFFTNDKQTTLIIGDVFGILGKTITGSYGFTRDYGLNNISDYLNLISKKPELEKITRPSNYTYSSSMGVISCHYLTQLYSKHNAAFDIRFSSNTSVVDIKKGNIIYAGPLRNENKFISLFNTFNTYFTIDESRVLYKDSISKKYKFFRSDNGGRDNTDMAIVSKFKGPFNNEYFLFFSNHDIGVKATVEKFTNLDSLAAFDKKHKIGNKNFTAVFEAEGKERTNLNLVTLKVVTF